MSTEIKKITAADTWQIRHEVMWPDHPFEYVQLPEDEFGFHFGAFAEEKLVAIVSCFITENEMQFRKLATLIDFQGKGIASELLQHIFDFAKSKGIKKIWCNARSTKTSFYEKFGMVKTPHIFEKSGQEFIIMEILF